VRPDSKRLPAPSARWCATTTSSRSKSQLMAASDQSKPCSTSSTVNRLMSMNSRFILPISMTFSSPSLAIPTHRKAMYDEHSFLYTTRFGDDAAARCPALAAQPLNDDKWPADADCHAGAVRLHARRVVGRMPRRSVARRLLLRLMCASFYSHSSESQDRTVC